MRSSLIILIGSLFIVSLATDVSAQSASKVVSQANRSLGGEKTLKRVTSWSSHGTITRRSDGVTGKYSAAATGGGRYLEQFDVGGFEMASGFNGKSGWVRDSRDGARTVTGDAVQDMQAEAVYRNSRWLRAKDDRAKLVASGTARVGERIANVVKFTNAKGITIDLFFDAADGRLLRESIPRGDGTRVYEYSAYRPVSGIQTPFEMSITEDDETYDVRIDEVSYNAKVATSTFDFPQVSGEPLPDIKTLLDEVRRNADRINDILENYSYTETRIERDLNSRGQLVEKSSEKRLLTFYKGARINRLIEKNGKPLSRSEQEKEDRDAAKQVAEIEKRIAERERREARAAASGAVGQPKNDDDRRISISEALKGSLLVNPRRERFKGRNVIVFDYEPDPAFKPQSRMERLFALCNGAVWVDADSKQVVRLDAVLMQSAGNFLAKARRGASFSLENEIVNDEIWLPSRADVNLSIKILFAGFDINNLVVYGDYRKFSTEVEDVKVGDEKP